MPVYRIGFMCRTDFMIELLAGQQAQVYGSLDELRSHENCVSECGAVKVMVLLSDVLEDGSILVDD